MISDELDNTYISVKIPLIDLYGLTNLIENKNSSIF